MKKLEELTGLEKQSNVELRYCETVADRADRKENVRCRILKQDGRYFFHRMKDGEVECAFELALSWEPFDGVQIFAYTPDDLHVYEIDSRNPFHREPKSLRDWQIRSGMACEYSGHTLEYVNERCVCMDGVNIRVEPDSGYVYKLLKTMIKAIDGARGLYIHMENEAERGKVDHLPYLFTAWNKILERYVNG